MIIHRGKGKICWDVEYSIMSLEPVELQLYTEGMTKSFGLLYDLNIAPKIERPGVVSFDESLYCSMESIANEIMSDPITWSAEIYKKYFITKTKVSKWCSIDNISKDDISIDEKWKQMTDLMAFVAINWMIPRDLYKNILIEIIGDDLYELWKRQVQVSYELPHFIKLEVVRIQAGIRILLNRDLEDLRIHYGCLSSMNFFESDLEVVPNFKEWATNCVDEHDGSLDRLVNSLVGVLRKRNRALVNSKDTLDLIECSINLDDNAVRKLHAITRIYNMFYTEEEFRHLMQRSFFRDLRLKYFSNYDESIMGGVNLKDVIKVAV